jgi:small subunit ribosomal protein S2
MKYKLPKIEDLYDAGAHYGHQDRRWHPKMQKYIYTAKDSMHIIDLEQTLACLDKACQVLHDMAKVGGQVIFVDTKRQARTIIETEAKACGALFVNERWLGGTITNYKTIKKNIDKLLSHIKNRELGEFNKYTKKERLLIDREIEKLQKIVGGLVGLKGAPSAVFVVDPRKEKTAVREAARAGIPVIAIIDTNSDPTGIDYVIPANDDAIKSIALIMRSISEAVAEGYTEFDKQTKDEAKKAAKLAETAAAKAEEAAEAAKEARDAKEAKVVEVK